MLELLERRVVNLFIDPEITFLMRVMGFSWIAKHGKGAKIFGSKTLKQDLVCSLKTILND